MNPIMSSQNDFWKLPKQERHAIKRQISSLRGSIAVEKDRKHALERSVSWCNECIERDEKTLTLLLEKYKI